MDKQKDYDDEEDLDGYNGDYDDPSLDIFCNNLTRSDEKKRRRKELAKQERGMK